MSPRAFLLFAMIAFAIPSTSQEFWNGTRHGMTKQDLISLFGRKLLIEEPPREIFGGNAPFTMRVPLCDWIFEVIFLFSPGNGGEEKLSTVYLHSRSRNPELRIGACVVEKYEAVYGKPLSERMLGFKRTFVKEKTLVEISTVPKEDIVIIKYTLKPSGI